MDAAPVRQSVGSVTARTVSHDYRFPGRASEGNDAWDDGGDGLGVNN